MRLLSVKASVELVKAETKGCSYIGANKLQYKKYDTLL